MWGEVRLLIKINSIFKFYHKMSDCFILILNWHCSFFVIDSIAK
ncbi:hypothetical protein [Spiroplasma endosymbiont of Virgichneumon dumeticola]